MDEINLIIDLIIISHANAKKSNIEVSIEKLKEAKAHLDKFNEYGIISAIDRAILCLKSDEKKEYEKIINSIINYLRTKVNTYKHTNLSTKSEETYNPKIFEKITPCKHCHQFTPTIGKFCCMCGNKL